MAKKRRSLAITLESIPKTVEIAKLAEDAGFESVWTYDTPTADAIVRCTAIALATKRIKMGPGVAQAFARSPLMNACSALEIHRLSGGRYMVGFGAGTPRMNMARLGVKTDHSASMLRDQVKIMKLLFAAAPKGERVAYQGKYFSMSQDRFHMSDLPPQPPMIYNAAVNPYMAMMTAEVCDGIAGHPCWYIAYIKGMMYPAIEKGFQRSGRSWEGFDVAPWITTRIYKDRKQARREAAYGLGNYLATRSYEPLLDFGGWQKEKADIYHAFWQLHDADKVADAVSDDMIDVMSIAGTPDEARKKVAAYEEIGLPVFIGGGGRIRTADRGDENLRSIIETFGE